MRSWLMVAVVGLLGCSRIHANEAARTGTACEAMQCGATVAVTTALAAGTTLTAGECTSVCANVWCGRPPIDGAPGCTLRSSTEVWCEAIAFDCGHSFGPRVRATEPPRSADQCVAQPCGSTIAITTMGIEAVTTLSADECTSICANAWCGFTSISSPGCTMRSLSEVQCGATAFDCGEMFPTAEPCPGGCLRDGDLSCWADAPAQCTGNQRCSACGNPDERCSVAACQKFKSCGPQLITEPWAPACANADGGIDATLDLATYCPDACNALHLGEMFGCIESAAQCMGDGGIGACLFLVGDAGVGDAGCAASCDSARSGCEAACARDSYRSCMDCAAACGLAWGRCSRGCAL